MGVSRHLTGRVHSKTKNILVPPLWYTNKELADLSALIVFVISDSVVQFMAHSNLKMKQTQSKKTDKISVVI